MSDLVRLQGSNMNNELTEEQKRKIEAEEKYRSQVRQKFVERPKYYTQVARSNQSGCSGCAMLILIPAIAGIIIVAIMSAINPKAQLEKARQLREQTENTSTGTQKSAAKGLGITRKAVMDSLRKDGFVFQKAADADGQESYMAINKAATVMLSGPAGNLTQAGITIELGSSNVSSTVLSQTYIFSLAHAVALESVKWIADDTVAHKDVSQPYKSSKVFGGNKFLLSYQPKMFMALFISPE